MSGEWKGFPNDDWKAATPPVLQSQVADLRDFFAKDARCCLSKATEKATVSAFLNSIPYRAEADAFHTALNAWSDLLSVLAVKTLSDFLNLAYVHSSVLVGYDPAVWAYAHALSLIHGGVLGEPDGDKKLPPDAPIRTFCRLVCAGQENVDPEWIASDLAYWQEHGIHRVDGNLDQWFASIFEWRAPLYLTPRAYTNGCQVSDRWSPVDEAETESTLRWLGLRVVGRVESVVQDEAKLERIKRSSTVPEEKVTTAPPPPHVVIGRTWTPDSEPTQRPKKWPANFPNSLKLVASAIMSDAFNKFPVQPQTTPQLCKYVVSKLTPHFCAAIREKTLEAEFAEPELRAFISSLVLCNCNHDLYHASELEQAVTRSDEWRELTKALYEASCPTTQQTPEEAQTAGPEDAPVFSNDPRQIAEDVPSSGSRFDKIAGPLWKAITKRNARKRVPDESLRSVIDSLKRDGFSDLYEILEPAGCKFLKEHNPKNNRNPIRTMDDLAKVLGNKTAAAVNIRSHFVKRLSRAAAKS